MYRWVVYFDTYKPYAALPRLRAIAQERRYDTSYYLEGRYRQADPHCLFEYTLSGEGRFRDADGEHVVPAGSGLLCEVADPATAYYYPPEATDPWEFLYICFDGVTAEMMLRELVKRNGPIFSLPTDSGIIRTLFSWQHAHRNPMPITPVEGAAIVMELLYALSNSIEKPEHQNPANLLVRRAQQVIQERLEENLTATRLAECMDISREHLTRVFREQFNTTPYQYILREKTWHACHLLKETDLPVKAISLQLGCSSPALFTRQFQSQMRMTPTQFRKVGIIPIR